MWRELRFETEENLASIEFDYNPNMSPTLTERWHKVVSLFTEMKKGCSVCDHVIEFQYRKW